MVDADGRYHIFHGVNVVYKIFPFYPDTQKYNSSYSLCDEDLQNLQKWGFNFIRLHVAWEGAEPQEGVYNQTYIQELKKVVDLCAKYDIAVLLDAHQDLLSKKQCGEGAPDWAMVNSSFPSPLPYKLERDSEGYPLTEDCLKHEFFKYYLTTDVGKNFLRLYFNQDQLTDHFAGMWGEVAKVFKDSENVIGYELLNEPFGDVETLTVTGVNNKLLLPFYSAISKVIRKYDNDTIVFFEPTILDVFGTGFKATPEGEDYLDRQIYSYHVYCPNFTPDGEITKPKECAVFDDLTFRSKGQNQKDLKIGGFLTEFGAIGNLTSASVELAYVTQEAEKRFHSWCYWQFKYYGDMTTQSNPPSVESFYDDKGDLYSLKVKTLSRPYAYKICGKPVSTVFDMKKEHFALGIIVTKHDCNGKNTEIFLSPEWYYLNGF